ncbi:uncharacterized protein PSFLO_05524 [Pseudozyma flocculosa]|uniref:C2H2-type domain-containing protein n=1 Tax=Pseudozyma flocculosa TaxID=84751 RepID=A0A5C3F6M0_9BASI|nr:uncharacterized protein PSFLO_05524 [Pseudozyma flocculosa]
MPGAWPISRSRSKASPMLLDDLVPPFTLQPPPSPSIHLARALTTSQSLRHLLDSASSDFAQRCETALSRSQRTCTALVFAPRSRTALSPFAAPPLMRLAWTAPEVPSTCGNCHLVATDAKMSDDPLAMADVAQEPRRDPRHSAPLSFGPTEQRTTVMNATSLDGHSNLDHCHHRRSESSLHPLQNGVLVQPWQPDERSACNTSLAGIPPSIDPPDGAMWNAPGQATQCSIPTPRFDSAGQAIRGNDAEMPDATGHGSPRPVLGSAVGDQCLPVPRADWVRSRVTVVPGAEEMRSPSAGLASIPLTQWNRGADGVDPLRHCVSTTVPLPTLPRGARGSAWGSDAQLSGPSLGFAHDTPYAPDVCSQPALTQPQTGTSSAGMPFRIEASYTYHDHQHQPWSSFWPSAAASESPDSHSTNFWTAASTAASLPTQAHTWAALRPALRGNEILPAAEMPSQRPADQLDLLNVNSGWQQSPMYGLHRFGDGLAPARSASYTFPAAPGSEGMPAMKQETSWTFLPTMRAAHTRTDQSALSLTHAAAVERPISMERSPSDTTEHASRAALGLLTGSLGGYRPELAQRPRRGDTAPPTCAGAPATTSTSLRRAESATLRLEVLEQNGKRRTWYRGSNGQFASGSRPTPLNELDGSSAGAASGRGGAGREGPTQPLRRIRKRRKGDEIDRKYICDFAGCDKAYGTLNHLNTHRLANDHGPRLNAAGRWLSPSQDQDPRKAPKEAGRQDPSDLGAV